MSLLPAWIGGWGTVLGARILAPTAKTALSRPSNLRMATLRVRSSLPRQECTLSSRSILPPLVGRSKYRCFSTSRFIFGPADSSSSQGPNKAKVKIVPFQLNVTQATETFSNYHGHSFFSAKVSRVDRTEALYLPFWAASGSIRSRIISAQVGWDRMVTRYNHITKQNESTWETTWRIVQTQHEFSNTYPSTLTDMQVYASYKYRRGFVNQIRSSESILAAKAITPRDFESTDFEDQKHGLGNRGMDPFTMKPQIALKFVKQKMEDSEVTTAEAWLIETYRSDKARIMSMDFQYDSLVASPIYIPAFVFTITHLNRHFRTFVNGHDPHGIAGGLRFYSWQRIGGTTAFLSVVGLTLLGSARTGFDITTGFWAGVVLPSFLISYATMYYPILDLKIRDWWRQREIAGHAAEAYSAEWETDWTKAYDRFEEEQRRQDWQENNQYQRQSTSRSSSYSSSASSNPDPLGYYAALGVKPSASVQEIQSAFRGLAMKWHPDRFSTPKDKAAGSKKFKEISAAYTVLRDAKKRKLYDTQDRGS